LSFCQNFFSNLADPRQIHLIIGNLSACPLAAKALATADDLCGNKSATQLSVIGN
jgi:hypothetical protein